MAASYSEEGHGQKERSACRGHRGRVGGWQEERGTCGRETIQNDVVGCF